MTGQKGLAADTNGPVLSLAAAQELPEDAKVVSLVLPRRQELLPAAVALTNRIPAVLPSPTTKVDDGEYQRNLLHQLHSLPADHLITLPGLAEYLSAALPYSVSGCTIDRRARTASLDETHETALFRSRRPPSKRAGGNIVPEHESLKQTARYVAAEIVNGGIGDADCLASSGLREDFDAVAPIKVVAEP